MNFVNLHVIEDTIHDVNSFHYNGHVVDYGVSVEVRIDGNDVQGRTVDVV